MILFQQDWQDASGPRAVRHTQTKNFSFLRMVLVLQRMGIKNNDFHLALLQPELADVDPHDPNLSEEIKLKIALECRFNAWYFLREVVRIPMSGSTPTAFELHRGNLAMAWCYYNNIDYTSTQPRQTGKTMGAIALAAHVQYCCGYNVAMAMYTHSTKLVHANVARLKEIRDALPPYLVARSKADTDNKEELAHAMLKNTYRTFVGQSDKQAAHNIGRGQTFPTIHTDEGGFIANIDISLPVLLAAQTKARENARKNGQPHANVYTTTAASLDTDSGKYMYSIVNGAFPFTEKLYDCKDVTEAKGIVRKNSTNGVVNGTFSYLQLGKTHEWFIEETTRLNATEEEIDRDFRNIWRSGSEFGIIPAYILAKMRATKCEPHYVQITGEYAVSWYLPQSIVESAHFRARPLVLGMDSSEQIGRDFTALVLFDPADMRVIATFRCNESNLAKLGKFIGDFLVSYPGTLFVPERKSSAMGIIDTITLVLTAANFNPFLRIFNHIVDNLQDEQFRKINIHDRGLATDSAYRKHFGFMTTGTTREFLFKNVLIKSVQLNADRIFDDTLITEMASLTTKNGRVDHKAGKHDDLVIAYLLACYAVFEGKNLHMYGLDVAAITAAVFSGGKPVDPRHHARQLELRSKISHYDSLSRTAPNEALRFTYKQKADQLRQFVDDTLTVDPISKDHMRRNVDAYNVATPPPPVQTFNPALLTQLTSIF